MAGYNATYFFPDTPQANGLSFWLYFEVTRPINLIPNNGVLAESPKVIAPTNQSKWKETPEFCWEAPVNGEKSPIKYLVRIIGANQLYSGWIADTCWHPATPLPTGSYTWKVIAKDKRGYMNPPNQNPYTFKIISRLMMDYE